MIKWSRLEKAEAEARALQESLFPMLSANYVSGEGDCPQAFIIGEAPGADEDVKRRPFVGPAGRVMRDLMAIADLRAIPTGTDDGAKNPNCWLTNAVKFRPPRNRKPLALEVVAFRNCLLVEWLAVGAPTLIIPTGGTALHAVLGHPVSILRAAGKPHKARSRVTGKTLTVWPMVHPSYGMRGGEQLQETLEQDWERLGEWRKRARAN